MVHVVIVFMIVVFVLSMYRLRRGGPGPAVNWVPRRMRGKLNSVYERQGWQKPYDEHGDRSADRTSL